jgi:hypothetical protein
MRDLTKPDTTGTPAGRPKGLSFDIADLVLIRSWADCRACRIAIRLDHGTDGEEYEEVIAFHAGTSSLCHSIMWRNAEAVFVQPLIGCSQRFASVAEALECVVSKPAIVLTDITATAWPTDGGFRST